MTAHRGDNRKHLKLAVIPGQSASPKAFCGMLLERSDDIEHIACVIQWKRDDQGRESTLTNIACTQMNLGQKAWMKHVFDEDFMRDEATDDDR